MKLLLPTSLLFNLVLALAGVILVVRQPLAPYEMTDQVRSESPSWAPSSEYLRLSAIQALAPIQRGDIVFAGDSQIAVCPWGEWYGSARVKNRGISGDGVLGLEARLSDLLVGPPAQLYMLTGANDLWNNYSLAEVTAAYERVLRRIRHEAPGTEVYVLSTTFMARNHINSLRANRHARTLNAMLQPLAEQEDVTFVDVAAPMLTQGGALDHTYTDDGGHLNGAGCAVVAEALAPYIQSALFGAVGGRGWGP